MKTYAWTLLSKYILRVQCFLLPQIVPPSQPPLQPPQTVTRRRHDNMYRDEAACNTYNYGDALYWDARYVQEAGCGPFDWYQRYAALRPFVRKYIPSSSRVLMVGCGNAGSTHTSLEHWIRPVRGRIKLNTDAALDINNNVTGLGWILRDDEGKFLAAKNVRIEGIFDVKEAEAISLREALSWLKDTGMVMSEDMVKDGYEDIVNVDISSVAIDMMKRKHEHIPQLQYMQMDVRDMSLFPDESFDSVIDKGTLDSLMCGTNAPISASQMLGEVSRLLKPGGVYMLITYGDPSVRMPHLNRPVYNWKIELYNIPRPGFQKSVDSTSDLKSYLEPIPLTEAGLLPADYVMEDPDSHFIYICKKPETR